MRHFSWAVLHILVGLSLTLTGFAQNQDHIKGKVLDASNNNPVEFANLGVVGTFLGTATDFDGVFLLEIDKIYRDFNVTISAVGYTSRTLKVRELLNFKELEIKLSPTTYGISQVDIKAQSMVLFGILKSAANMIGENYVNSPFSWQAFYSHTNEDKKQVTEAILSIRDSKGYGDRSYSDVYESQSYIIEELRRNYDCQPIEKGIIQLDDVLLFDVVRVRGNILDTMGINTFDLKLEETSFFMGDSVWVISYRHPKPDFSAVGIEDVDEYQGVIYISQASNAIVKNEITLKRKGYFPYGLNAFSNEELRSEKISETAIKASSSYRKNESGKWFLSGIALDFKFLNTEGVWSTQKDYLKVLDLSAAKMTGPNRRQYYASPKSNNAFWDRFTIPEGL